MAELEPQGLTDVEIFTCVDATVHDVLLPVLPDDAEWARAAAIQLVGLVRYAARRGPDRTDERVVELADLLEQLSGNEIVGAAWDGDRSQRQVMAAIGATLVAAVGRDDAAGNEIRAVLRPAVVRQLDDELAETASLVDAFRGKLSDG
jgi:hypothetical protein